MVKVTHVVGGSVRGSADGVAVAVRDLNRYLPEVNINSKIMSVVYDAPQNENEHKGLLKGNVWFYAASLRRQLSQEITDHNSIIHTHGIWAYPQYIAHKLALRNQRPYVITPHGMLEPWLCRGSVKKKIYLALFQQKYLHKTSIIHAITPQERDNLYHLTKNKAIEVIPNLIATAVIDKLALPAPDGEEKYILFLGRLHPVKGIELLINAFARLADKNITLRIAGPKNEYGKTLLQLAESLDIAARIEFTGLVTGAEKYKLYRDAWVFVAPSYSEVIGMVNLEAGWMATPVITTAQTGILPGWGENGGMLINPDTEELCKALSTALAWSDRERNERGRKLKAYVALNYSWEANLHRWKELYTTLE